MKKWYKQVYFNRRSWILEYFDKLNLNAEECMVILLIDFAKEANRKIDYDYFLNKLKMNKKEFDKVLANLVAKHYISINSNDKGISFDIDNIFDFDPEKYEVSVNKDVYDLTSDILAKPLSPNQIQKVNDLVEKYGENKYKDALRVAEACNKRTLYYIEGVLRNEKK